MQSTTENNTFSDQNTLYLDTLRERNPLLIEFSAELHRRNELPVGTYVLDLEAHKNNARAMSDEAGRNGIKLYYMSKQIARNPLVTQSVINEGFHGVVAVEPQEIRSLVRYRIRIGHVGHLVNIPENEIDYVLKYAKPEVITVFNYEKARMISQRAERLGVTQDLLVRPMSPSDTLYPYMEGGVPEEDAVKLMRRIDKLPNVKVTGVTSFPCMLFDLKTGKPVFMPNIDTLGRVSKQASDSGIEITQVNTPPMCISKTVELYAKKGATHLEPGLGMTGMSPWQIYEPKIHPEIPAGVYVTEVSHFFKEYAYVYGGGFAYIEVFELAYDGKSYIPDPSKLKMKALVGQTPRELMQNPVDAEHYRGLIDYHARLYNSTAAKELHVGDTVVYGFRAQMFVTRAQVAVVSGIRENDPKLVGIFDQANNLIDRYGHLLGEEKTIELLRKYSK